ncbi:MAG: pilus assembly protein PilM, partial [Bradymonadaceae bacterium]
PAVREFLDALDDCTIDPAVLGIPELMLRYVAEAACPVDSETPAILDLGHAHTRVLVLADGAPVLAKSIQKGGGDVIRSVADEFELSAEEAEQTLHESGGIVDSTAATPDDRAMSDTIAASLDPLIRELRRHFQSLYAGSGIQIDRIYLCGGLSQIDNLDGHIADQFDVPTRLLPVESAVDTGPVMPRRLREAALPVALALQQPRDRGGERLLNLRTDEFAFRGHSSYLRSQFLKVGAVAALLFALVCGALFARKIELEARRTATRRAIEKQTKELFGAPASTTSAIQKKVAGGPATTRPFVPRMSAYQLFYKMMTTIPEDLELNLDRLDIDTDRNVIQMSGTTKGPQMVDRLVSAFDEVDCLKNINKKPVKVRSDQETHFRLEITSSCS